MIAAFANSPERSALRASRAGAARLFTDFGVRLFVLWLDLMFLLLACNVVATQTLARFNVDSDGPSAAFVVFLPLYFALSWFSPLRATPLQFLFGMRVVDVHGRRLAFPKALLRAVALLAMVASTLGWFDVAGRGLTLAVAAGGCLLALLAALTPNRQGGHDLAAGSIVVNKRMLRTDEDWKHLAEIASQNGPAARRAKRPALWQMILNVGIVTAGVYVTANVALLSHDKDLRAGAHYAIKATMPLRLAVDEFYRAEDRWPDRSDDVGMETRGVYPVGGYFEMLDGGRIEIRFANSPELTGGYFELYPADSDSGIEWGCIVHGEIRRQYLPALCRP